MNTLLMILRKAKVKNRERIPFNRDYLVFLMRVFSKNSVRWARMSVENIHFIFEWCNEWNKSKF